MQHAAFASLPVEKGGFLSLLGSLGTRRDALDRHDAEAIAELVRYAAAAEQRLAEQRARIAYLESLSMTDELTGLANRRAFRIFLTRAVEAAARHEEGGVVGIFDLDDFKAVNDRHGHGVGDEVLVHVGRILEGGVRPTDCAARLGGDEFAIILTRTSPTGGAERLRRLQRRLCEMPAIVDGSPVPVAASLGCRIFDGRTGIESLLFETDRAMYQDKRRRKG